MTLAEGAWLRWGPCLEGPLIGDGKRGCGAGPETARKHARHRGTLAPYVAVMKKHAHRFPPDIPQSLLIDLTAGPGRYRDAAGVEYTGTGLIALEAFDRAQLRSVAVLFERVEPFAEHLKQLIGNRPEPKLGQSVVVRGDAWDCADQTLVAVTRRVPWLDTRTPFGLISLDCNGGPDLEALDALLRRWPKLLQYVDVWVHLPAGIMKLIRVVHGRGLLRDRVLALPKTVWKIRPSDGDRLGWVELVGTNWDDAPTWRAQGFLDLRSAEGQAALDAETLTRSERRARESGRQLGLALP